MKTILYTTDFSANSHPALKYAYELSKKTGAELVVLHVFDIPTIMNSSSQTDSFQHMEQDTIRVTKNKLQNLCETYFGADAMRYNIRLEAKENNSPLKGIIEMIEECNADLLVMGSKGESNVREILMGSTSKGAIEKAECPVLTVPSDVRYKIPKQIVYATDFEEEDVDAIGVLAEIAGLFDAQISVVHVSKEDDYAGEEKLAWFRELLRERVNYSKIQFELVLSDDDIQEELSDYVEDNEIDMITMLEREQRGLINKLFHRDLVKRMEFHTAIPLLSFNQKYVAYSTSKKAGTTKIG